MAQDTKKRTTRRVKKVQSPFGRAYIQSTNNNTIVTVTDQQGNTLSASSSGAAGHKGARKATPYAGQMAATIAAEKAVTMGLKEIEVFVKGIGSGRESAVRSLKSAGLNVISVADLTPVPHNGCRPKKARRV